MGPLKKTIAGFVDTDMKHLFNRIKTVYAYYVNSCVLRIYPMHVGIELTNNCNLDCVMCPHSRMTRQKAFMTKTLFTQIIDQIKGKTEFVYLYGMGESLLHPDFFEMADYAVKSGLKTSLSTNITLLDEEKSRNLLNSGIDFIVLALDGANKHTYEKIRVGAHFGANLDKIKQFLRMKRNLRSGCYVDVQFIQMHENKSEAAEMKKLFSKEERAQINMFRVKPVYASPAFAEEKIPHHHPCYFLWNTATITVDGNIVMCCMDYDAGVILGNLSNSSICDIWNSEKMAVLRETHKKTAYDGLPMCGKCSMPEKLYFSNATILASAIFGAGTMRKLMPVYEKLFINKK